MRVGRRDVLWLTVAILVHALLLLVPLHTVPPDVNTETVVSVSLVTPVREETVFQKPEEPLIQEPLMRETVIVPEEIPQQEPVLAKQPAPPAAPAEEEIEDYTTARLYSSASSLKWSLPEENESLQLGVFKPRPLPGNWLPAIELEENRFSEMYAPAETEIVDRWLAADGSHNVVINTPSGDTLCGRAQAWNPMSPLVEHVMMFRPCAGGGKRAFKMPDRFMRSR